MPTTGRCLCRAVTFAFDGAPLWVAHCHCDSCRRQTSSALATFVGVRAEQVRFSGLAPARYESSPGVIRSFCPKCGSPIAFEAEGKFPGEVHLFLGTLDDQASVAPRSHVHVGEQVPWFEVLDDLPRYQAGGGRGAKPIRTGPRPR